MNYARIILGGLVAGVVLNIGEFLINDVILGAQMKAEFERLRLADPGGSFIAVAVIMTFALGILLVMLYAMIRPRFGPGPKTAICAALIVWFVGCIYVGIIYTLLLAFPMNFFIIGAVWCLVEYSVATIAGAWVYKEA